MNFNADCLLGLEYTHAVEKAKENGLCVRVELIGKDRNDANSKHEKSNDTDIDNTIQKSLTRRVVRVQKSSEIILGVSDFVYLNQI